MRFVPPSIVAVFALLAAGSPVLIHATARAQSADDIIKLLKPKPLSEEGGARGIRPVAPTLPKPASSPYHKAAAGSSVSPKPASAAPEPEPVTEAPSLDMSIEFRTGSAELTANATRKLDELGKALQAKELASYKFRIEGHTDTVGTPDFNKGLSNRRAESVVAYLVDRFGVSPERLQAVGMGEDGLAVPTGDQVDEPRNRRVHVVNLGT